MTREEVNKYVENLFNDAMKLNNSSVTIQTETNADIELEEEEPKNESNKPDNQTSLESNKSDNQTYLESNKPVYQPLYGSATITIRFENRVQWQKYRMYILKTDWDFDGGQNPYTAQLKENFTCVNDVEKITKRIVELLQLGFDVYSCKWDLQKEGEQKVEYIQDGEVKRDVIGSYHEHPFYSAVAGGTVSAK